MTEGGPPHLQPDIQTPAPQPKTDRYPPPMLNETRILDLTDEPLAFGARILADFGADVIRIEDQRGDHLRRRDPAIDGEADRLERGWAHLLYNAGKRSVAVDPNDPQTWDAVESILPQYDALLAPLKPGAALAAWLERGRAGEWTHKIPVVDCVFRRNGEDEPTTDLTAMAAGGHVVLNGFPEDPPLLPAGNLAYKQASLAAAEAAMAMIMQHRRGGDAGWVTVGMQEAVTFTTLQTANGNYHAWHGHSPDRHTPIGSGMTFMSADAHWLTFTIHPPHWYRFVDWCDRALGDAEVLHEDRFDDEGYRGQHFATEIRPWVQRLCDTLTLEELTSEGQRLGLLVLPIHTAAELTTDPHLLARGFYQQVKHPQLNQTLTLPRPAVRRRGTQPQAHRAPFLGEHTNEILSPHSRDEMPNPLPLSPRLRGEMPKAEGGPPSPEKTSQASTSHSRALLSHSREGGNPEAPKHEATTEPDRTPPIPQADPLSPRLRGEMSRSDRGGSHPNQTPPPRQPLTGVRILDFCWAIAGSLGTRLLADLGAEVIKIESEGRLDPIRYIGVQPPDRFSLNTNGVFNDCSANKLSCTLNLKTEEGIETIRQLAEQVDVVTSNYTPYVLDRWGVGYDDLSQINPDIIFCNVAVMGIEGPRAEWRSYGNGIVGMCGLAYHSGFAHQPPIGMGTLHTDFTVPYYLATSVMAALDRRERTGKGAYIEVAQYETATQLLDTELIEALNGAEERPRIGNRSHWMSPHGVFPAAAEDRWLALACPTGHEWRALCRVIGRADLGARDDLATLAGRQAAEDEIEAAIAAWTQEQDEWTAARLLLNAGVPASPVERLRDFFEQDQPMRNNYQRVHSPEAPTLDLQHEPILWDGQRLNLTRAPLWGEHTEYVLRDLLNYTDTDIERLAAAGTIG